MLLAFRRPELRLQMYIRQLQWSRAVVRMVSCEGTHFDCFDGIFDLE
jgi:hypothetical protein